MFKLALALVAAATFVRAQDMSDIPSCVLECTESSLEAGGCESITDLGCICSSEEFQAADVACISENCPDLMDAAMDLQQSLCPSDTATDSSESTLASTEADESTLASTETGESTPASTEASSTTNDASDTASSPAASETETTTPNAGYNTASIAAGVTFAFFGAAISLF